MPFPTPILARAYGSEPVKLIAVESFTVGKRPARTALTVYRDNPTLTIGWLLTDAYQWDEAMYQRLRAAFAARNADELKRLWQEATPFTVE